MDEHRHGFDPEAQHGMRQEGGLRLDGGGMVRYWTNPANCRFRRDFEDAASHSIEWLTLRARRKNNPIRSGSWNGEAQVPVLHPRRDRRRQGAAFRRTDPPRFQSSFPSASTRPRSLLPVDPLRLVDAFRRHAIWMCFAAVAMAVAVFVVVERRQRWTAAAQVKIAPAAGFAALRLEQSAGKSYEDFFSIDFDLFRSPDLFRRVSQSSRLALAVPEMAASLEMRFPAKEGDSVVVLARRRDPGEAVVLANTYVREVLNLSAEQQHLGLRQVEQYIRTKLSDTDRDMVEVSAKLLASQAVAELVQNSETLAWIRQRQEARGKEEDLRARLRTLDAQIDDLAIEKPRHHPALVKAQEELDRLLVRYTENYPRVRELRELIADLRSRPAGEALGEAGLDGRSTGGELHVRSLDLRAQKLAAQRELERAAATVQELQARIDHLPAAQVEYASLKTDYETLVRHRELLARSQKDVRFLMENAASPLQVVHWAREDDLAADGRYARAMQAGMAAGVGALFFCLLLVGFTELADGRVRTPRDLEKATGLPVLATLGDLGTMTERERDEWSFRTLTILKGRLGRTGSQPLVCGFIAATPGEGVSTWIDLLAGAARRFGHTVVKVTPPTQETRPVSTDSPVPPPAPASGLETAGRNCSANEEAKPPQGLSVLSTLTLTAPEDGRVLEWRARWSQAVQEWKRSENLVLLVELPPASDPRALMLSDEVPQVVWLCLRDRSTITQTRSQMETLRNTRCTLAGAVMNRVPTPRWKSRFAHWVNLTALMLAMISSPPSTLAQADATPGGTGTVSIGSPQHLADWQKRLTLGPGDAFSISIFEEPDSARGLVIGPDGRINYLEAQDVMAAGLTVDELRDHLDKVLADQGRRAPRTVIIPSSYNSKRYYMLGNTVTKGVFALNRPMTLVEAVAQARGFVSRDGLVLADLARSFWIRKGADGTFAPLTVDFEAVFLRGDLSQNLPVAPGDYLYFPPADSPDVFVLGEVPNPGPIPFDQATTVMRAVIAKGGFTENAYKTKVLIVRGSLTNPETFIVDLKSVLKGTGHDYRLQARDIVYVHRKPWWKAEELANLAIRSFIRAAATAWVGDNIDPIITTPIF